VTARAGRLCAGHADRAEDIESELLTGFLHALRTADVSGPAPYARLCWAGWRAARTVRMSGATACSSTSSPPSVPSTPSTPIDPLPGCDAPTELNAATSRLRSI